MTSRDDWPLETLFQELESDNSSDIYCCFLTRITDQQVKVGTLIPKENEEVVEEDPQGGRSNISDEAILEPIDRGTNWVRHQSIGLRQKVPN